MANREYEAWFLAAVTSMKGKGAVKEDAEYDGDCEVVRDAKGAFERLLRHAYHAPTDQPMYSEMLDLSSAFQRSRSFRRMVHAFANLAESDGKCCHYPPEWVNCEGPR